MDLGVSGAPDGSGTAEDHLGIPWMDLGHTPGLCGDVLDGSGTSWMDLTAPGNLLGWPWSSWMDLGCPGWTWAPLDGPSAGSRSSEECPGWTQDLVDGSDTSWGHLGGSGTFPHGPGASGGHLAGPSAGSRSPWGHLDGPRSTWTELGSLGLTWLGPGPPGHTWGRSVVTRALWGHHRWAFGDTGQGFMGTSWWPQDLGGSAGRGDKARLRTGTRPGWPRDHWGPPEASWASRGRRDILDGPGTSGDTLGGPWGHPWWPRNSWGWPRATWGHRDCPRVSWGHPGCP